MLELLFLAGSALGIAAMVFVNTKLSIWKPARLHDLEDAKRRLDVDAVGFRAGNGVLSADRTGALVEDASSPRIGLLTSKGDNMVIRYLTPGTVKATRLDGAGSMRIALADFTFAPVTLTFDDNSEARFWADKLNALQA